MMLCSINGMWNFAFYKPQDYKYQQEYRFLLERNGKPDDHWILELGSLDDITIMMPIEQALNIEINQVTA